MSAKILFISDILIIQITKTLKMTNSLPFPSLLFYIN